jgi:hypothetical protein
MPTLTLTFIPILTLLLAISGMEAILDILCCHNVKVTDFRRGIHQ